MKSVKALIAVVALLMVGCGSPDLDDKETLDEIIAEAIDEDKLQKRGKKGEELRYAPDQNTPYTGWSKRMHDNGQISWLFQYKDGKRDGPLTYWYSNKQKESEWTYKDGNWDGLKTSWYRNGQKKDEATYKDGNKDGLQMFWYPNGQKKEEGTYKDGKMDGLSTGWYSNGEKTGELTWKDDKLMTAVAWKPNGEECPHTNVVNGNGVVVGYREDGTEDWRVTYKDGELVKTK